MEEMHWLHVMPFHGPCLTPGSVPTGWMAFAPMSVLLQLPQSEQLALAIALWDSLDDHALGPQDGGHALAWCQTECCVDVLMPKTDPELQRLRQQASSLPLGSRIIRAVASSTAIETGQSVAEIELELRNRQSPQSTPA